jgi:hypothetical protein
MGPDGAGNAVLKVYRDSGLLLTTSVQGIYRPAGHSVRIAASSRRADDFGAPIGAIFSNVRVWDLSVRRCAHRHPASQQRHGQHFVGLHRMERRPTHAVSSPG